MKWTPEELARLKDPVPNPQLAKELNRSLTAVQKKRQDLRIPAPQAVRATPPSRVPEVSLPAPEFGHLPINVMDSGSWFRYGLIGDTHLCCREERLSELHAQYDIFQKEGIQTVFHAGNIVDGYVPRINGGSVYESSIDGQAQYCVSNYPARKGITTFFITGDDHEGWWQKEGFNFGAYLQLIAEKNERTDLRYIGHVEADVELKHKNSGSTIIKIQHPGGGSAYARSYAGQKQIESWEGGEKPHILVQGHYHVSGYFQDRNVHLISLPGFQDQTIFARKKRLRMEVGGAILEFKVSPADGTVTRCRVEFNRFFTRGFYKHYLKSDKTILKGHLVIKK